MCGGGGSTVGAVDLGMDGSKLLELAATGDLSGFVFEVEERGLEIDGASSWYGRSFGSNRIGFEERTPILIASMYGSLEVLKYILRTGKVDVNRASGSDRATALHCVAAGGSWSSVEVVELLIGASADVDARDVNGRKPGDLIAACAKNSGDAKRRLLEMMLNGGSPDSGRIERREYPVNTSLPDINVGVYGTDEFRMYTFKVMPCSRAYSHEWTECPFVHPGENARRRDPRKYHYTCVPCPEFKKGNCGKGDGCEYAHGVFESWLHPAQYRTRLCKDETGCGRKVCFFAHKPEELRPLYASTGSGMPSPNSGVNSLDMAGLSLGSAARMVTNSCTPPMSPGINCSSPMGGGASAGSNWMSNVNLTPPVLQLPGSRLNGRRVDFDAGLMALEKIQAHQRQQLVEEMAAVSPYNWMRESNPTGFDDVFVSQMQLHSQAGLKMWQSMSHQLRGSYSPQSSPSRMASAAAAAAIMNSRSPALAKRSQSFVDRSNGSPYPHTNPTSPMQLRISEWSAPDGRLDWGFSGDEMNKLRKSASFNPRSGGNADPLASPVVAPPSFDEPDVSWVHSLVKDASAGARAAAPA